MNEQEAGAESRGREALIWDLKQKLETVTQERNAIRDRLERSTLDWQDAVATAARGSADWAKQVEDMKLQVGAFREALAKCVDGYGCSYSAQGEYEGCSGRAPGGLCEICRGRRLLHGLTETRVDPYRQPKGKDILGAIPDLPGPPLCRSTNAGGILCIREEGHCGAHFAHGFPGCEDLTWSDRT